MASKVGDTEYSSSDDEGFELMRRPVLPVDDFTEYDPTVPPQTGAEYLRRVQLEAKKEPKIKVASNLREIRSRTLAVGNVTQMLTSEELDCDEFIPSKPQFRLSQTTIDQLINNFICLQKEVEQRRDEHGEHKIDMRRPKKWWRNYCLVRKEEETGDETKRTSSKNSYQPTLPYSINLPRFSLLAQLDHSTIFLLLKYFCQWIEEQFTVGHGLWIYSLMATLDSDVQTGGVYNLLREISRLCSRIRHRIEVKFDEEKGQEGGLKAEELQQISSLSTIILIVGRCFGQKDLLDEPK